MTDINKYRNVSLTHETYKTLIQLSKVLLPDATLSISKTIESIANEKAKKLNGKIKKRKLGTLAGKPEPWYERGGYKQVHFPKADYVYGKEFDELYEKYESEDLEDLDEEQVI